MIERYPVTSGATEKASSGRLEASNHASGCPTIVNLEMGDAEGRPPYQFVDAELLVHATVMAPVPPGIHHHHLVPVGEMPPHCLLVGPQGPQGREFPTGEPPVTQP